MPRPSSIRLVKVQITANTLIAPGVHVICFPRFFDFHAGQVVAVGLRPDDDARLYSIASGVSDPEAELVFSVRDGGYLTPAMEKLRPGDTLYVSEPFGNFLGTEEEAWWLSAGTGIAPFRSMLRSGYGGSKLLMHSGRTFGSFYFQQEMQAFLGKDYIRCLSGPRGQAGQDLTDTPFFEGRITTYLEAMPLLPNDILYYLCGSAEFVISTRELLLSKRVPYEYILSEIYF